MGAGPAVDPVVLYLHNVRVRTNHVDISTLPNSEHRAASMELLDGTAKPGESLVDMINLLLTDHGYKHAVGT